MKARFFLLQPVLPARCRSRPARRFPAVRRCTAALPGRFGAGSDPCQCARRGSCAAEPAGFARRGLYVRAMSHNNVEVRVAVDARTGRVLTATRVADAPATNPHPRSGLFRSAPCRPARCSSRPAAIDPIPPAPARAAPSPPRKLAPSRRPSCRGWSASEITGSVPQAPARRQRPRPSLWKRRSPQCDRQAGGRQPADAKPADADAANARLRTQSRQTSHRLRPLLRDLVAKPPAPRWDHGLHYRKPPQPRPSRRQRRPAPSATAAGDDGHRRALE